MSDKKRIIFRGMLAVNIFCALTEACYYLLRQDNLFFNCCAVIWFLAMLANMSLCLLRRKSAVLRTFAMLLPPILTLLNGMLGTNATNQVMGIALEVLAFLYFCFSSFHAWYLNAERFPEKPDKKANLVGLIFYGLFYLAAMGTFLVFYYYTLIEAELSMSSTVAMLSGFMIFLPVLAFSASLGLARRLRTRKLRMISATAIVLALVTLLGSAIPIFAAADTAQNADAEYVRVFGGEEETFCYSLPQTLFGSTEWGYTVTKDVEYMTMTYEGKEYALAYDMYKLDEETAATPVVIRLHGSGGSKGMRNNTLMSAAWASEGFTVFDINYGNEKVKPDNDALTENICGFLNYLYEHQDELNIDVDNIFLTGESRGGKMALMSCVAWSNNTYYELQDKVTIRGAVLYWGFMNDVFTREGDERIVSLEELNADLPPMLFVDTTNDGSIQGGNLMEGVLYTLGVKSANIELRYAMHGASHHYYGVWGQLCEYYGLRFFGDMTVDE